MLFTVQFHPTPPTLTPIILLESLIQSNSFVLFSLIIPGSMSWVQYFTYIPPFFPPISFPFSCQSPEAPLLLYAVKNISHAIAMLLNFQAQ